MNNIQEEWNNATPVDMQAEWDKAVPTKPNVEQPPEQGFMSRIGSDFDTAMEDTYSKVYQNQDMTAPEKALGYAKAGWRTASSVPIQGLRSAYQTITPKFVQDKISQGSQWLLDKTGLSQNIKDVGSAWGEFEKENPRTANVIGAGGRALELGATLAPINASAEFAGKTAGKLATKVESLGKEKVSKILSSNASKSLSEEGITEISTDVLKDVKPDYSMLSKTERLEAGKSGNVEIKGKIFKDEQLKTTYDDVKTAKSVEGVYDPKDNWTVKIDKIESKIGELAEQTAEIPAKHNIPIQTSQIRKTLELLKEESDIPFVTNSTLEQTYNKAIDTFMNILEKKPKTLSSVLESRKEFDQLMKQSRKTPFDERVPALTKAQQDVRRAANEFVRDSLSTGLSITEEGARDVRFLGDTFMDLLDRQHLMYKAKDGIAFNNTATLNPNMLKKVGEIIQSHPILTAEVATGALAGGVYGHQKGGGFLAALAPAALSALAIYGTYKVGKEIFTSQTVRDGLVGVLKAAEKSLSPTEKLSLTKTIDLLSPKEVPPIEGRRMSPYSPAPVPDTIPTSPYDARMMGEPPADFYDIKRLPEGQGFDLKGSPYDADIIDAQFTSQTRPILEGQGQRRIEDNLFNLSDENTLRRAKQRLPRSIIERKSNYQRF